MGQIPRSIERISSYNNNNTYLMAICPGLPG